MFVLSCIARMNDPKNFASVGRRSGRSDRSTSVIQQTSDSKADVKEGPGRVKPGMTRYEHNESGLLQPADVRQCLQRSASGHEPTSLQSSSDTCQAP